MIPTQEQLDQCVGDCDLPKNIDTVLGLKGLFTNTEVKFNAILDGPGNNHYKARLLRQLLTSYEEDASRILSFQIRAFVEMVNKLGDDVLQIPELRINRHLITNGIREKPSTSTVRKNVIINGITYKPTCDADTGPCE
jgi:hypothetical protein